MKVLEAIVIAVVTALIDVIISGVLVYFLWNWLVPEIFSLKEITFWQAIGLSALSSMLFKSSGSKVTTRA